MSRVGSLWHGIRWLLSPYEYFRSGRLGLTWRASLPGLGRVLVSGDPALLGEVMAHPDLVGGRAHQALRATLGEDHLIVLWGAAHRERRRVVQQALRAFPRDELIAELTRQEVEREGRDLSLHRAGHRASLRIVLQGLLGPMDAREEAPIVRSAERFARSFSSPLLLFVPWLRRDWGGWSPWGRLLRRRRELCQLLVAAVPRGDCMAARLRAELAPESYEVELLALLMFGHETTAGSLSWCLAHALQRPECAARVCEDEGYALAFVQECLRVSPPVAQLTRVAESALKVGEWNVAEGEVVMPAIPLAHRSLGEEFEPERFLGGDAPSPPAYCPFGFGTRLCPGRAVALRQLTVMVRTLLRDFRWRAVDVSTRPYRHLFLVLPRGEVRVERL